ncbi:MAG TPA: hypothetical protein VGO47_07575, partial [Chlamydiales bacterium]|nr:hypothetical protein [Chlamydiales bacterium]
MFGNITILATAVLMGMGTLTYLAFVQPHPHDKEAYQKIIRSSVAERPTNSLTQKPTYQHRTNIQKDLWLQDRHVRITSPKSRLCVQQLNDKFEITEHLESLECCLQETLTPETQEIRWLSAKEGVFEYPTTRLQAKEPHLSLYSLEGTEFPESIPQEPPNSSVQANSALWEWPNALRFAGNVRLFSNRIQEKKTFALADELFLYPSSGKVELLADRSKKVLLWQDEMQLSSPSIEIQRDAKNKTDQIKGIGDVHFYFTG